MQDDSTVFATGVDQKVSQFSLVRSSTRNPVDTGRWIYSCSRRMHSHDVRALVTWPPHQPFTSTVPTHASLISKTVTSFVISGGLDMAVCICPCVPPSVSSQVLNLNGSGNSVSFEDAYYRRMPFGIATSPTIQVAPASKLILCRNDNALVIWRVDDSPKGRFVKDHQFEDGDGWTRVADLKLKSMTNLVTSAISNNGEWIAASDYYEAKLFRLNYNVCRQRTLLSART